MTAVAVSCSTSADKRSRRSHRRDQNVGFAAATGVASFIRARRNTSEVW